MIIIPLCTHTHTYPAGKGKKSKKEMSFVKTFRVGLSRIVYARVRAAHAKRHVSLSWIPRHFRSSLIFFRLHDRYKRKNATRGDDADSPLFSGRWGLYKIVVE
jgi:hypothetical protein